MKVSKKFDKRYNIKKYQFIRNYANQNKIESIWKHKEEENKVLIVNWKSKSSYFIEEK